MLTPAEVAEIQSLAPLARLARAQHAITSDHAMASRRLSEIFAAARTRPQNRASISELAAAASISYHSAARRVRMATDSRLKDLPPPAPALPPQGEEGQTHVPSPPSPSPLTFEEQFREAVNTPNPDPGADHYSWSAR